MTSGSPPPPKIRYNIQRLDQESMLLLGFMTGNEPGSYVCPEDEGCTLCQARAMPCLIEGLKILKGALQRKACAFCATMGKKCSSTKQLYSFGPGIVRIGSPPPRGRKSIPTPVLAARKSAVAPIDATPVAQDTGESSADRSRKRRRVADTENDATLEQARSRSPSPIPHRHRVSLVSESPVPEPPQETPGAGSSRRKECIPETRSSRQSHSGPSRRASHSTASAAPPPDQPPPPPRHRPEVTEESVLKLNATVTNSRVKLAAMYQQVKDLYNTIQTEEELYTTKGKQLKAALSSPDVDLSQSSLMVVKETVNEWTAILPHLYNFESDSE